MILSFGFTLPTSPTTPIQSIPPCLQIRQFPFPPAPHNASPSPKSPQINLPLGSSTPFLPRARYCIYRGLWASLPENKHNDAPENPHVYESDLPTFTTDVRMQKVPELFATGAGHGDQSQSQGSGGGGPVEAVWWVKDVGVQWRIKGTAWVVARDIEGEKGSDESSGVRSVKSEVGARMQVVAPGREGEWSWKRELTGHFGNCSPGMRGEWLVLFSPSPLAASGRLSRNGADAAQAHGATRHRARP